MQLNVKKTNNPIKKGDGRSKQTFLQRRQMAKKHMKRCSTLLIIIQEMQIKTTVRYHFTWAIMAIIKKSTNNKWWREYGKKGTVLHSCWEYKMVQPLWRVVWKFLEELKIELSYNPAIFVCFEVHLQRFLLHSQVEMSCKELDAHAWSLWEKRTEI